MTGPDVTPAERLADDLADEIERQVSAASKRSDPITVVRFFNSRWRVVITALRASPPTLSATVPGVTAAWEQAAQIADACANDDRELVKTGAIEKAHGLIAIATAKQIASLIRLRVPAAALLTPAPAVTQSEPEAAPTREEMMHLAPDASGNHRFDTGPPAEVRAPEGEQSKIRDVHTCLGLSFDPPPAPSGASVEAVARRLALQYYQRRGFPNAYGDAEDFWPDFTGDARQILAPQADVEQMRRENEKLRQALIDAGVAVGALLGPGVSTDFLLLVPQEVRAKVATLEAERDEARRERVQSREKWRAHARKEYDRANHYRARAESAERAAFLAGPRVETAEEASRG